MARSTILGNAESRPSLIPSRRTISAIVFTDQPAPKGKETVDVSEAKDKGVVRWEEGNTVYLSTQRPGIKVTAPTDCTQLFRGCVSLERLDVAMLDVSNVTDMTGMFMYCRNLPTIEGLETWDVGRVERMADMFSGCTSLTNIDAIAEWDVRNVYCMNGMFDGCRSITNVDAFSKWDVREVEDMRCMFNFCKMLASLSSWYEE
jgi:surface protein